VAGKMLPDGADSPDAPRPFAARRFAATIAARRSPFARRSQA
jgi:hypothetical protein